MRRAIWSGSISFGLVNVPVKLYSAVKRKDVQFHQFDKSGNRIHNKRVSEKSGREVDYDDIVKGYELSKGEHVLIEPGELEAYRPESTRTVEISDFVDLAEIDPIFYDHTYYLAPDGKPAHKPYALLLEAMQKKGRVAIGTVVIRTKQYLAAVRPFDGALALSTMLFADEIVPVSDVVDKVEAAVSDRELKMAMQIIDSLTSEWEPERYHDTYREEVLGLIKKKAKGQDLVVEEPEEEKQAEVLDLMAALEASLAEAKRGGRAKKKASSRAGKKTSPSARKKTPSRTRKSA
jgi:DNA end-binding protein Ku